MPVTQQEYDTLRNAMESGFFDAKPPEAQQKALRLVSEFDQEQSKLARVEATQVKRGENAGLPGSFVAPGFGIPRYVADPDESRSKELLANQSFAEEIGHDGTVDFETDPSLLGAVRDNYWRRALDDAKANGYSIVRETKMPTDTLMGKLKKMAVENIVEPVHDSVAAFDSGFSGGLLSSGLARAAYGPQAAEEMQIRGGMVDTEPGGLPDVTMDNAGRGLMQGAGMMLSPLQRALAATGALPAAGAGIVRGGIAKNLPRLAGNAARNAAGGAVIGGGDEAMRIGAEELAGKDVSLEDAASRVGTAAAFGGAVSAPASLAADAGAAYSRSLRSGTGGLGDEGAAKLRTVESAKGGPATRAFGFGAVDPGERLAQRIDDATGNLSGRGKLVEETSEQLRQGLIADKALRVDVVRKINEAFFTATEGRTVQARATANSLADQIARAEGVPFAAQEAEKLRKPMGEAFTFEPKLKGEAEQFARDRGGRVVPFERVREFVAPEWIRDMGGRASQAVELHDVVMVPKQLSGRQLDDAFRAIDDSVSHLKEKPSWYLRTREAMSRDRDAFGGHWVLGESGKPLERNGRTLEGWSAMDARVKDSLAEGEFAREALGVGGQSLEQGLGPNARKAIAGVIGSAKHAEGIDVATALNAMGASEEIRQNLKDISGMDAFQALKSHGADNRRSLLGVPLPSQMMLRADPLARAVAGIPDTKGAELAVIEALKPETLTLMKRLGYLKEGVKDVAGATLGLGGPGGSIGRARRAIDASQGAPARFTDMIRTLVEANGLMDSAEQEQANE